MLDVDMFVMDYFPGSKALSEAWQERGMIQKVAKRWLEHIAENCLANGLRLNLQTIENEPFEDGLDFTVRARKHAFEMSSTGLFILSDNDMLPYTAESIQQGIEVLMTMPEFAILSAWPEPHSLKPIELPGRTAVNDEFVMEHYSCGGFRFCRKIDGELNMPEDRIPGYDGKFCRYLWDQHRMKVGYLKKCRAMHLGTHCTSLWNAKV